MIDLNLSERELEILKSVLFQLHHVNRQMPVVEFSKALQEIEKRSRAQLEILEKENYIRKTSIPKDSAIESGGYRYDLTEKAQEILSQDEFFILTDVHFKALKRILIKNLIADKTNDPRAIVRSKFISKLMDLEIVARKPFMEGLDVVVLSETPVSENIPNPLARKVCKIAAMPKYRLSYLQTLVLYQFVLYPDNKWTGIFELKRTGGTKYISQKILFILQRLGLILQIEKDKWVLTDNLKKELDTL